VTDSRLPGDEQYSNAIVDSLPGVFYLFDTEGRFLRWNQNMELVTGFSSEELVSIHPLDLFRGSDRLRVAERIQEVFDCGQSSVSADFVAKDGTATPYFFTGVRTLFDGVPYLVGVGIDLSDRVRAETALRESEQRYRRFFMEDISADFIASADGTLVDCNPAYLELFGFNSIDEAKEFNVAGLFPSPEDRIKLLARLRGEASLTNYPLELRRLDGTPLHVVANVLARFDQDGNLETTRGYLFDVTEMRHLEAQLRHAQKMEAVGNLAGGVAHDFNNLLQAMLGQVELLALDADPEAATTVITAELERLVLRGADLTRQLLLFSRRQMTSTEIVDLNDVLRETQELLRRLTRANVNLRIAPWSEPLWIEVDRAQIGQVLMNLVINAVDAMPTGGDLTLATLPGSGEVAMLAVTDSGDGIPSEIREQIFEPFYTTKDKNKGTGLGLSVVHGIVARHHGSIEVDSAPGRGTTFRILLPLSEAPSSESRSPAISESALPVGAGERILVVEDEEDARATFARVLEHLGYEVEALPNGNDVEMLLAGESFDLLLTDLMLPGISGREVAALLTDRWPEMKVIIMSGYAGDEDLRRRVASGDVRFLQKPFQTNSLAHAVRAALDAD